MHRSCWTVSTVLVILASPWVTAGSEAPPARGQALFNGKNLDGWVAEAYFLRRYVDVCLSLPSRVARLWL